MNFEPSDIEIERKEMEIALLSILNKTTTKFEEVNVNVGEKIEKHSFIIEVNKCNSISDGGILHYEADVIVIDSSTNVEIFTNIMYSDEFPLDSIFEDQMFDIMLVKCLNSSTPHL